MRQKGFTPLIIILVIAIIGVVGYFGYRSYLSKKFLQTPIQTPVSTPKSKESPTPSTKPTLKPVVTVKPNPKPISNSTSAPQTSTQTTTIPTQTPTNTPSPTQTPNASGTISVNTNSVNVTLSRTNAQPDQLIYGTGFTITSQGSTSWEIHLVNPVAGVGFDESSGGITPGGSVNIRSYINSTKANGIYNGFVIVGYFDSDGHWQPGPTVSYSITLTD